LDSMYMKTTWISVKRPLLSVLLNHKKDCQLNRAATWG